MDYQERAERIETYGSAYVELTEALKQFPPEMWKWQAPGGWSIHEIICHLADAEANAYARFRRLVAEPGSTVLAWDEDRWTAGLGYHEQSFSDALELFRWLRITTHKLLKALPEGVWEQTVEHSETGTLTLDNLLAAVVNHVYSHIEQMGGIYQEWQAQERG